MTVPPTERPVLRARPDGSGLRIFVGVWYVVLGAAITILPPGPLSPPDPFVWLRGLATVASGLAAGRDNRDFLKELELERTTNGTPVMEPADKAEATAAASTRRPTYETEDLDIPAFLRRGKS